MKFSKQTKSIVGVAAALACGMIAFFLIEGFRSTGVRNHQVWWIAQKLHIELPPLSAESEAVAKADAIAWKAKFLAEFPALQVTFGPPLAAEENGFWSLVIEKEDGLPISKEFSKLLSDLASCDLEVAKRCLAEHPEQVAKVEHIASLKTRSSSGMPDSYNGFFQARVAKQCADILLLKARLAAAAGHKDEALRLVESAENLADHMLEIETPTFLSATVGILIDLQNEKFTLGTLLPAIGPSADLEKWRSLMVRRQFSPAMLAKYFRGEWHTGADYMAFPILSLSYRTGEMPDAEASLRAYSSWVNETVIQLSTCRLADMDAILSRPANTAGLSNPGKSMLELLTVGSAAWGRGYVRAAVVNVFHQAALDLLILEKSGITLSADDTKRIPHDPYSGQPFTFDPATRKLTTTFPGIEPLALPW